eukprot:scaffold723_cov298-Alexandrium_tamarense.AAC.11
MIPRYHTKPTSLHCIPPSFKGKDWARRYANNGGRVSLYSLSNEAHPTAAPMLIAVAMWRNVSLPSTNKLIGRCVNHQKVCTDRARFHAALARLGMTSMESEEEKGLLFGLRYEHDRRSQQHRLLEEGGMRNNNATSHGLPNQIFLYETRQIHVTTASNELSSNIQQYLNIQHPLKEILSYSQSKTRAIDICHDNHTEVRKLLVEHSTDAADWIEQYFVKSTNVVVSAQDYFFGLLDDWRMDPCKGRQH